MAVSWTGWTHTKIVAALAELFGDGWARNTAKAAIVNEFIYSAWVESRVLMPQPDAAADPDDVTVQKSAFNQYWGKRSFAAAGLVIDGPSDTVLFLQRDFENWARIIGADPSAHEGIFKYVTP